MQPGVTENQGTKSGETALSRLWILGLVWEQSRWLTGLCIGFGLLALFYLAATLTEQIIQPEGVRGFFWSPVVFFCALTGYIVPVFHFITTSTEAAFDELRPHLPAASAELPDLDTARLRIAHKTRGWVLLNASAALLAWFFQQWLLMGDLDGLWRVLSYSVATAAMTLGPLPVWIASSCTIHALIDNALMFRRLARAMDLDLLDRRRVLPIGRMAVYSTLLVIGGMALMSIMAVGGQTSWWGYVPGLVPMSVALVVLFFVPQLPLQRRLRAQKTAELDAVRETLLRKREAGYDELAGLLAYRREIGELSSWPIDVGGVGRLVGYIVIVPLTWIGAALIELLVDSAVG